MLRRFWLWCWVMNWLVLLFLLVFTACQSLCEEADWTCPQISLATTTVEVSCSCEISHTLRLVETGPGVVRLSVWCQV